jgi:hypothetical protein
MKDLTRREIVILCAYAVLVLAGLRWLARELWPAGGDGPALSEVAAAAPSAPAAANPVEAIQELSVSLRVGGKAPGASFLGAEVRVFASRACPLERLSAWLAAPDPERREAAVGAIDEEDASARFDSLEGSVRHVSVYVNGRLAAVTLACESDRDLTIELDPARLVPPGASVHGCFRDSLSLVPLKGHLTLERGERITTECELDAEGSFLLSELEPGPACLVAHFDDRGVWRREVELGSSARIELCPIDLPRACAVRGRLLRPDAGIAAFPVLLEELGAPDASAQDAPASPSGRNVRLTYAEEDGRFQFAPLDPGRYLLRVPAADEGFPCPTPEAYASAVQEIEVREGLFEEHDVRLGATRQVVLRASKPLASVLSFQLLDAAGHVLRQGRLRGGRLPELDLVAGGYALVLSDAESARAASRFEVSEGTDALAVELAFETADR